MKPIFFFILFTTYGLFAQKTLQLVEDMESPKASLKDVSWIQGHWKGDAFGGTAEEIWSPPMGGSMMFVFKLVNDGAVSFYEVGHIREINETLLLQLKHFHGDLKGWETKDQTVDFKLVKIENKRVFFEGFTIEKISGDEINMHVLLGEKEEKNEVTFAYQRVNSTN
ncbi:DUF6265 family protein [Flagellimonas allohymeniacidonis]|uniref:DUF6265 domain-containing protein n=1 Tax=Flagellimonas allohymeniacidonis TaxID=2517819 RepID=A0A4Q8QAE2_9FLAO|nr:DUF6265 family protein [Allomuricauda hymeniacidonis]TAI47272.1 hypothetical protein EW142_11355 [Allomuricauda hymeniacidonis]